MKEMKKWLGMFVLIFSVWGIAYSTKDAVFPWLPGFVFLTILPVGIFFIGWVICLLYTNFFHTKIKPGTYQVGLIFVVIPISLFFLILFGKHPNSGNIMLFGLMLSGYLSSLFGLMVENK